METAAPQAGDDLARAGTSYTKAEQDAADLVQTNAIALNTAKVGITTTQASDITANNAKVTGDDRVLQTTYDADALVQNDAITLNTAKTGVTDEVHSTIGEPGAVAILNMVSITQAEYDLLTPVATTVYMIVG